MANSIVGLVSPSIETVVRLLKAASDVRNMSNPLDKNALMLESEGVPVFVKPQLM